MPTAAVIKGLLEWSLQPVEGGYALPYRLVRKLTAHGTLVKSESAASEVSGKAVFPVGLRMRFDVTRFGRRRGLSARGCTVVPSRTGASAIGHLVAPQKGSLKAKGRARFELVAKVLEMPELFYSYMFVAVADDKACSACMQHDGHVYGLDDILRLFPYATEDDYSLWMPNLHPSCRCMLVLLEIGL